MHIERDGANRVSASTLKTLIDELSLKFPGWGLVGGIDSPNFEIRMDLDKPTGDVYFTFSKDYRFMNIRVKNKEILEVYPSGYDKSIFKNIDETMFKDVENYAPYMSMNWKSGEYTHLYCVINIDDRYPGTWIGRWDNNSNLSRMYCFTPNKITKDDNFNYKITYHNGVNGWPTASLRGYNYFNPYYDDMWGYVSTNLL